MYVIRTAIQQAVRMILPAYIIGLMVNSLDSHTNTDSALENGVLITELSCEGRYRDNDTAVCEYYLQDTFIQVCRKVVELNVLRPPFCTLNTHSCLVSVQKDGRKAFNTTTFLHTHPPRVSGECAERWS